MTKIFYQLGKNWYFTSYFPSTCKIFNLNIDSNLFSHWKMKIRYLKNDNDFLIFLTEMKYDSPIIEVVNNAKLHEENIMTSYNLLTQNWY